MSDNLIKILINNTYHGFLGLFCLLTAFYTSHSLVGKQSVFGWVVLILLILLYLYHTMGIRKVEWGKDDSSK